MNLLERFRRKNPDPKEVALQLIQSAGGSDIQLTEYPPGPEEKGVTTIIVVEWSLGGERYKTAHKVLGKRIIDSITIVVKQHD